MLRVRLKLGFSGVLRICAPALLTAGFGGDCANEGDMIDGIIA